VIEAQQPPARIEQHPDRVEADRLRARPRASRPERSARVVRPVLKPADLRAI
jgi:hypothetical protein